MSLISVVFMNSNIDINVSGGTYHQADELCLARYAGQCVRRTALRAQGS